MKKLIYAALAAVLIVPTSANAIVSYDFAAFADGSEYGESAYEILTLSSMAPGEQFTLQISASETGNPSPDNDRKTYVYLDATSGGYVGGMGVCGKLSGATGKKGKSNANVCNDSSDDNTTQYEALAFEFTGLEAGDLLDVTLYVNNNHDGGFDSSAKISVNNSLFSPVGTGKSNDGDKFLLGTFSVTVANSILNVAYSNEQFYVRKMVIAKTSEGPGVPEPATLLLTGLGFLGMGYQRYKRSTN